MVFIFNIKDIINNEKYYRLEAEYSYYENNKNDNLGTKPQYTSNAVENSYIRRIDNKEYSRAKIIINSLDSIKIACYEVWNIIELYYNKELSIKDISKLYNNRYILVKRFIEVFERELSNKILENYKKNKINGDLLFHNYIEHKELLQDVEKKRIDTLISSLSYIEREVMEKCYLSFNYSISEIAKKLDIDKEEVRKIIKEQQKKIETLFY